MYRTANFVVARSQYVTGSAAWPMRRCVLLVRRELYEKLVLAARSGDVVEADADATIVNVQIDGHDIGLSRGSVRRLRGRAGARRASIKLVVAWRRPTTPIEPGVAVGAVVDIDEHLLTYPWTFTYFKKAANKSLKKTPIRHDRAVEDFWRLYVHLRRPVDERPTVCDYGFREHSAHVGGRANVRVQMDRAAQGPAARYWEDVVRASSPVRQKQFLPTGCALPFSAAARRAGGQFKVGDEICGCVSPCFQRTSSPSGTDRPTRARCACRSATRCAT